jgi:hypothetical protein
MRTIFTSTALVGAMMLAAPAQAAVSNPAPALAVPQLKISGQTSFNTWFFNNKHKLFQKGSDPSPWNLQKYGRGQLFSVDDSRLRFTVEGKTDRGMEYGMVIVLDGEVGNDKTVRENYLFFGGSWGKLFLGDTYGVQSTMAFGGWDQWGGTGFMEGQDFDRVVNYPFGTLHSVNLVGDTNRDTKVSYLTPRWKGLQLGVTYTPRSEHRGEQKIDSITSTVSPKKPFDTDNIASGLNFIHKFACGFEMALSATSIFAKENPEFAKGPKRRDIAAYALGGTFSYANVGFSLEYGNNGKSRELANQNLSNAGQFMDFGLSYTWGATKFSTGYYYGWRNALGNTTGTLIPADLINRSNYKRVKSKTHAISAAIDHKLAPGLGVYVEYANFQMKNPAAIVEASRTDALLSPSGQFTPRARTNTNRANAVVVGSRLVF